MSTRALALTSCLLALTALSAMPALGTPLGTYTYSGAGVIVAAGGFTVVTNPPAQTEFTVAATLVDNGAVVCDTADDSGRGGVCVPFDPANPFVSVLDSTYGREVAFQVCIDNTGDGICGNVGNGCEDQVFFSHGTTSGAFHNPLGPLPTSFLGSPNCPGGLYNGYVVMLCAGAHLNAGSTPSSVASADTHNHDVSSGVVETVTAASTGFGDFCGSPTAVKAYAVL